MLFDQFRRRDFITLFGGAAAAWPLAARAQRAGGMRRIGVLMNLSENDPEARGLVATFREGLAQLGWIDGRNVQIDYRWSAGNLDRIRRYAAELVALPPEVILAYGGSTVGPLQQVTRTVPIVFVEVIDPVGGGFVMSLARPGGNTTGFSLFEFGISGKWLELLKQITPRMTRAVVIRDPSSPGGGGQLGAIQALAPAFYPLRYFATSGGLISYGPERLEPYRRAPSYVDRILKGEKPADLPVQAPTKYELVINLKTAKALGLTVPHTLLARADEVIE